MTRITGLSRADRPPLRIEYSNQETRDSPSSSISQGSNTVPPTSNRSVNTFNSPSSCRPS